MEFVPLLWLLLFNKPEKLEILKKPDKSNDAWGAWRGVMNTEIWETQFFQKAFLKARSL